MVQRQPAAIRKIPTIYCTKLVKSVPIIWQPQPLGSDSIDRSNTADRTTPTALTANDRRTGPPDHNTGSHEVYTRGTVDNVNTTETQIDKDR